MGLVKTEVLRSGVVSLSSLKPATVSGKPEHVGGQYLTGMRAMAIEPASRPATNTVRPKARREPLQGRPDKASRNAASARARAGETRMKYQGCLTSISEA